MNEVAILPPSPLPDMTAAEAATETTNPAGMYLMSLGSLKSRRDLGYALSKFARRFFRLFNEQTQLWEFGGFDLSNPLEEESGQASWQTTDWRQLRAKHIELAQAWVRGKGLSQSAEGQYINALRGVMGKCFELGYVDAGVEMRARRVKAPAPNDHKPGRAFERHEIVRLIGALDEERDPTRRARDYAVFALMVWAGLRIVDTQNLNVEDVLDEGRTLIVHRKGRKVQKIALNPLVTGRLNNWLAFRGRDPGPVICRIGKGTVVKPGLGISKTSYANLMKKYVGMACVGEATPHDLRSTFATRMAALGVPLQVIQELLGHSKVDTTIRYLKKLDQAAAKTIQTLDIMKDVKE